MDWPGSGDREVFDELDIARQSSSSAPDLHDAGGSQPIDHVSYGHTSREPLVTSLGDVLPNPGVAHDDEEYFMGNLERGEVLIFSHDKFDVRHYPDEKYQPSDRIGADADKKALQETFKNLGFEVKCFDNLRYYEICNELRQVAEQDHSRRDCVAVAVLSHGERNGKLDARDRAYHVSSLWEPFTARRCPTLAGKPKLFFIQACKGQGADPGVIVENIATDATDDGREEKLTYPVPSYADILVSYATFEGLYCYRNPEEGSWYVQTLCDQLEAHGRTKDLLSLLTGVSRIVGQNFRSNNSKKPEIHGMVQSPCFTSSLTRRLCFGYSGPPRRP